MRRISGTLVVTMVLQAVTLAAILAYTGFFAAPDRMHEQLMARVEVGEQIEIRYLPMWMYDDRYARWHRALEGDLIELSVLPLSACEVAVSLPEVGQPWRTELETWITERRDHIVDVSGLRMGPCAEGAPTWLSK